MELRTIKPARNKDQAFLGFYCPPEIKGRVIAVAEHYNVSVSQLLLAFAENAPTLVWFVSLPGEGQAPAKETRQLAG